MRLQEPQYEYIVTVCPVCRRQLFGNTVYCSGRYEERHERTHGVDISAAAQFPSDDDEAREASA